MWCAVTPNNLNNSRTTASTTVTSGPSRNIMIFIGRATASATRSGALMAIVFGNTSAKITTSTVMKAVA